jgi:hypothetical protein
LDWEVGNLVGIEGGLIKVVFEAFILVVGKTFSFSIILCKMKNTVLSP